MATHTQTKSRTNLLHCFSHHYHFMQWLKLAFVLITRILKSWEKSILFSITVDTNITNITIKNNLQTFPAPCIAIVFPARVPSSKKSSAPSIAQITPANNMTRKMKIQVIRKKPFSSELIAEWLQCILNMMTVILKTKLKGFWDKREFKIITLIWYRTPQGTLWCKYLWEKVNKTDNIGGRPY